MDRNEYFEDGMEEKAKNFEQMLQSGESFFYDNDELSRLIDYYLDFDQLKKANRAIAFGEQLFPFESYYQIKKSELYIAQRNINAAIKLLEKYRQIEPQNGEIAKLLGDCYTLSLQYKRALEMYLFAHSIDANDEEILIRLIRINFVLGKDKKAMSYLNAISMDFLKDELSIQELTKLFIDINQYSHAKTYLQKVIDADPYNYSAWYFMGLIHQRQDQNKEAIDAYEYCIAIDDHNTMGHLGKGNCLMELGNYPKAIESLKLSLDNDETDAEVLCNIAECYENLKDDNAAKYHYQKSLKINPNLSDAYFGIACIYKRNNQWKDAERNLLKAIDIDRYEVIYNIELAELFLIQENKEKCYHYYHQAQQIDQDTIEILLDYAHAKFELGDLEDAVQLLMDHIEYHDKDARIFYRIASYTFTLGQFEKGYNFLHAALKLNPKEYILLYEFAPFLENNQNITNIIDIYIN